MLLRLGANAGLICQPKHYTLAMRHITLATCRVALVAAALCAAAASPAQAQWKWRDAAGRITVSDRPPPRDVADKDILQRPAAPAKPVTPATPGVATASAPASGAIAAPAAAASAPVDKELEARKRAAEAERAAKAKLEEDKQAAQRADNCKRARGSLAALDSGQRISRFNDKGEREILDDAARATETRRAREAIISECKQL